jgi:ABC-type antimicrobial peptide transport system permease subunit
MKIIRNILISSGAGLLSVIVGWFTGYAVGVMTEDHSQGLGSGLPTVWLMDVFAFAFGLIGFVACLVWRILKPN